MSFGVTQMTVEHGHIGKAALKAANRLRSQADFRDQYDCLAAIADNFANRLNVDFGLAAASDAMQKESAMLTAAQDGVDAVEGLRLIGIQLQIGLNDAISCRQAEVPGALLDGLDQSFLAE